jgi:DNA-binding Lrp family transcriptional regulator
MCLLRVGPQSLGEVGRAVAGHPEVRFAGAVTGQVNLVSSLLARTTDELYAYLSDRLGSPAGVHTAKTALVLRRVKSLTHQRG